MKINKTLLISTFAFFNSVEGVVHLIVASIGMWGCIDLRVFDIRVLLPNIENYVFGIFSILTGIIMVKFNNKKKIKPQLFKRPTVENVADILLQKHNEYGDDFQYYQAAAEDVVKLLNRK